MPKQRRTSSNPKIPASRESQDCSTHRPKIHKDGPIVCGIPRSGSAKSPIFHNRVSEVQTPRRSLRLSPHHPNTNEVADKNDANSNCTSRDGVILPSIKVKGEVEVETSNRVSDVSRLRRSQRLSTRKLNANEVSNSKASSNCKSSDKVGLPSSKVKGEVKVETSKRGCVVIGLRAAKRASHDVRERNEQVTFRVNDKRKRRRGEEQEKVRVGNKREEEQEKFRVSNKRKRRRGEEASKGVVDGWTKEQEIALQTAYFAAKPTPHFWKKVSKMVPGKSAQDCFDKINSDYMTPPPVPRQSRAKRINSSPLGRFSLSASKLLINPSDQRTKRSRSRPKSQIGHKTVRELLQKQNLMVQDYEADLFSILEPNTNPPTQDSQTDVEISTPMHLQEKQGVLYEVYERSSGHKKPLSGLSTYGVDILSPPVLKPVKDKALHDKYIDKLHCREAKRKAACARAGQSDTVIENLGQINVEKIDVVRAAKNALVSDVKEAINQLHDLQANGMSSSSDFADDGADSDDDEGENRF